MNPSDTDGYFYCGNCRNCLFGDLDITGVIFVEKEPSAIIVKIQQLVMYQI